MEKVRQNPIYHHIRDSRHLGLMNTDTIVELRLVELFFLKLLFSWTGRLGNYNNG